MEDRLYLFAPGGEFLLPYIKAVSEMQVDSDSALAARMGIMISSCAIYGPDAPEMCDETYQADDSSPWKALEEEFSERCSSAGIPWVILRCADIVATGMTGFTRHLANAIWRGSFFHFPGNEARRSVVHGSDIAAAIALIGKTLPQGNIYNITDGVEPTIHDLAEAIAFRLRNKRISTLSTRPQQIIGRLIYGKRRYALYTTSRTFSNEALLRDTGFKPKSACNYLRTHVYDENSL